VSVDMSHPGFILKLQTKGVVMPLKLKEFLDKQKENVLGSFGDLPEIETVSTVDESKIPKEINRWLQLEDAIAVFADIQGSTRLAYELNNREAAAVIETGIKAIAETFHTCDAKHAQIQGDGAYAVFYGEMALENAMVAAITIQTFSQKIFKERIKVKFPKAPATGIKVGVAAGPVIVKVLGKNRVNQFQDPSWVGIPVNFASKAASAASPGKLVVTATIWDRIWDNEYLTMSCVCNPEKKKSELWEPFPIQTLSDYSGEEAGYSLSSTWCDNCGSTFSERVLAGFKTRDLTEDARLSRQKQKADSLNKVAARTRASVKAYKRVM
jgi:class 3 adenylate cyclase